MTKSSSHARIVRAGTAMVPVLEATPSPALLRRMSRDELEARLTAERIIQEARAQADAIVAKARVESDDAKETARREGHAEADIHLTSRWLALRQAESDRLGADVDRVIHLAKALAERLIGSVLELEPDRVLALATSALAEARGSRRAVIHAHPADAKILGDRLHATGLDPQCFSVEEDETLRRGSLQLHTDVGIVHAELPDRLERLGSALRDVLQTK